MFELPLFAWPFCGMRQIVIGQDVELKDSGNYLVSDPIFVNGGTNLLRRDEKSPADEKRGDHGNARGKQ